MGTGAVAAGHPQFQFPKAKALPPRPDQFQKPVQAALRAPSLNPPPAAVARAPQTPLSIPIRQTPAPAPFTPRATPLAPAPREATEAIASLFVESEDLTFTYLLKRAMAYLMDAFINACLCVFSIMLCFWYLMGDPVSLNLFVRSDVLPFFALFVGVFNWAVLAAQETAYGTSLGKRAFGLSLDRQSPERVLLRSLLFQVSLLPFGLGVLAALGDRQKRAWHDRWTDLQPSEIAE